MVLKPCVTNGRQLNEFNRLSPLRSRSIFRSRHMVPNGPGKAVAKLAFSCRRGVVMYGTSRRLAVAVPSNVTRSDVRQSGGRIACVFFTARLYDTIA